MNSHIKLSCNDQRLKHEFVQVKLLFDEEMYSDVFAEKNNKTLGETVQHKRYKKFADKVRSTYTDYVDWPLGDFLLHLKTTGDGFYKDFLNKYGDKSYCRFSIDDQRFLDKRGLYTFILEEHILYIGRCRDSFRKRINQGYGKIHPKNCYIDGQATNCHLNARIAMYISQVQFAVLPLTEVQLIESLERELIARCNPPWNIALKTRASM